MDFTVIKTIIRIALNIVSTSFITKYDHLPSMIFRFMIWCKRLKRHVILGHADKEDYTFSYFSRGKPGPQPSILMLHGFSFNKDVWLDTLELFPQDLHVVCVDMPGHGDTTRLLQESYTATAQTRRIHQFVEWIGLNKNPFHLVGMSMGGMVAGLYAAEYPSEICALSLLCPAGLRYPTESEFFVCLKELVFSKDPSDNTIVSVNEKEGEKLLQICLYDPSFIKTQLVKGYLDDRRPHKMFFVNCFLDVSSALSRYSFHDNLRKIKAPTQIIWGKHDKVFDSSGADILATTIPNSQVHLLEKCGHLIALERPKKSAQLLLKFYNSFCDLADNKKVA
ncbi:monoacylglycerol lipase ABHD6-like [Anolis sagrei]|uniref:monoacylglycerol lipase ABHD6-like n=1 Tax=Anolis sagrei TaxID=38937 RepID=UPI003520FBDC